MAWSMSNLIQSVVVVLLLSLFCFFLLFFLASPPSPTPVFNSSLDPTDSPPILRQLLIHFSHVLLAAAD